MRLRIKNSKLVHGISLKVLEDGSVISLRKQSKIWPDLQAFKLDWLNKTGFECELEEIQENEK